MNIICINCPIIIIMGFHVAATMRDVSGLHVSIKIIFLSQLGIVYSELKITFLVLAKYCSSDLYTCIILNHGHTNQSNF